MATPANGQTPQQPDGSEDNAATNGQSEEWTPPAWLNTAKDRYYWVRNKAIEDLYHGGDEKAAFAAADEILTDPGLPILLRAKFHMILATDDSAPSFLSHARQAVYILEEECPKIVERSTIPTDHVEEARRILKDAEELAKRRATEQKEAEEEGLIDEEDEDEGAGGEEDEELEDVEDVEDSVQEEEVEEAAEGAEEEAADEVPDLPSKMSSSDKTMIREAMAFGATSRHGLFTPATSAGVSRTASNKTAASRRSSRQTKKSGGDQDDGGP